MSEPTFGSWSVRIEEERRFCSLTGVPNSKKTRWIVDTNGNHVALLCDWDHQKIAGELDPGAMAAAAPEMLGALEMVRDADEDCKKDGLPTMPSSARKRIDDAIAKAEGRS